MGMHGGKTVDVHAAAHWAHLPRDASRTTFRVSHWVLVICSYAMTGQATSVSLKT